MVVLGRGWEGRLSVGVARLGSVGKTHSKQVGETQVVDAVYVARNVPETVRVQRARKLPKQLAQQSRLSRVGGSV